MNNIFPIFKIGQHKKALTSRKEATYSQFKFDTMVLIVLGVGASHFQPVFSYKSNYSILPNWRENDEIFPNCTGMGTVPKKVKKITVVSGRNLSLSKLQV